MRIRSFIIAYALVLAILLFADRRPGSTQQQDRYSHVVDLTDGQRASTRMIAPGALIPGTWTAGQIPAERLIAPLAVIDLKTDDLRTDLNAATATRQISLDDIATWESRHGMIPQGSVVAIRRANSTREIATTQLPIAHDAAQFLIDARCTIGFAVESPVDFSSDRTLARQIALRGAYVVEGAALFTQLPATGALVIVAPGKTAVGKNQKPEDAPVRVLAMVR